MKTSIWAYVALVVAIILGVMYFTGIKVLNNVADEEVIAPEATVAPVEAEEVVLPAEGQDKG